MHDGRFAERRHAEGEVLAEAGDEAAVENLALPGRFGPDGMPDVVRHCVLRGRWWIECRKVGAGCEGTRWRVGAIDMRSRRG